MNVLLLSMPDAFEHMPALTVRMPSGALASLAGNVDPHHRVAVADLILVQSRVRSTIERLLEELRPDVVGLSVMTFQRRTALGLMTLVRARLARARIVVGGYDPSLAPDAYEACEDVEFIVRGEGEHTLRELLRELEGSQDFGRIPGLSYRAAGAWCRNLPRPVLRLASEPIGLPNRGARVLQGYTLLGRQIDVVETSRGCTFDCSFCSIIEMRGRNFHPLPRGPRAGRHPRRARPRRARHLPGGRQHHARHPAVRDALPRDRRSRPPPPAVQRAGDDRAHRRARRDSRSADAPRRVPLRVPRHRERAGRRPALPEGAGQERPAGARPHRGQRHDRGHRAPAPARHVRRRRPDRRQPRRHARVDRSQYRVRAPVRRLALHPAPDALSRHADDRRVLAGAA